MFVKSFISVAALAVVTGLGASIGSAAITIPTVGVGNAGNANDPLTGNLFGAMANTYRIGTNEVTNTQYTAFLNAVAAADLKGLYSISMPGITRAGEAGSYTYTTVDGRGNMPVTYVSFADSARFCNWLHNGQPTGEQNNSTTEDGAYLLTNAAITNNTITRKAGWQWALPSENEWYKAAYHQPQADGGDTDGYWAYPIGDNAIEPGDANYRYPPPAGPSSLMEVGSFAANYYGTYDMAGNVFEWTEAVFPDSGRGTRGGSFVFSENFIVASRREDAALLNESDDIGFRVVAVPAPGAAALLGLGGLMASRRRRSAAV